MGESETESSGNMFLASCFLSILLISQCLAQSGVGFSAWGSCIAQPGGTDGLQSRTETRACTPDPLSCGPCPRDCVLQPRGLLGSDGDRCTCEFPKPCTCPPCVGRLCFKCNCNIAQAFVPNYICRDGSWRPEDNSAFLG